MFYGQGAWLGKDMVEKRARHMETRTCKPTKILPQAASGYMLYSTVPLLFCRHLSVYFSSSGKVPLGLVKDHYVGPNPGLLFFYGQHPMENSHQNLDYHD